MVPFALRGDAPTFLMGRSGVAAGRLKDAVMVRGFRVEGLVGLCRATRWLSPPDTGSPGQGLAERPLSAMSSEAPRWDGPPVPKGAADENAREVPPLAADGESSDAGHKADGRETNDDGRGRCPTWMQGGEPSEPLSHPHMSNVAAPSVLGLRGAQVVVDLNSTVEASADHDSAVQKHQRTVVVVASGLALAVAAVMVNRLLADNDGGWFAYAPNTGATITPSDRGAIWRDGAVWLVAIGAWTGLSLWIYRGGSDR